MVIPVDHTKGEYWGGTQLNFALFKWSAILLGGLGVDHLLLRSPTTALIKVMCNILTLGYFYFYDVVQVLTEEELVIEKGLSMPFVGYMGIGEGIFTKPGAKPAPKSSPKPYMFAVYCIAVLIGFGSDFLVAGDLKGAAAKIFSLLPLPLLLFAPIFWIFTLMWWMYNIVRVYLYTSDVLSKDPNNKYRGVARFFPFTVMMKPYHIPFNRFIPPGELSEECDRPLTFPWNMIAAFWTAPANAIKSIIDSFIGPAKTIIESGKEVVVTGSQAIKSSIDAAAALAREAPTILHDAKGLVEMARSPGVLGKDGACISKETPNMYDKLREFASAYTKQKPAMKGGAIDSTQEYILLSGLITVALGGFGLTFIRGLKNGSSAADRTDDRPPEPRTGRKPLF